ncbi:hypothetical protein vseg_010284 [Gypsophila vaccaria]
MSLTAPDDGAATAATARPWSEFFSSTSISLPVSISKTTSRIRLNLYFFKLNYLTIFFSVSFISCSLHPLSFLLLFLTALTWHYLYFSRRRDDALEVIGAEIDDRVIVAVLSCVTVVALVYADVWLNLEVSVAVSVVVVLVHAVVRVPSFGDDNPYV